MLRIRDQSMTFTYIYTYRNKNLMSGVPLLLMDVTALRKMRFQTRVGNHCAETSSHAKIQNLHTNFETTIVRKKLQIEQL
jgi:hypothetical protein